MKNIPNFITCLNLLAGCMACVMSLRFDNYTGAFVFVSLAAVFDFMDGLTARTLKFYSRIGKDLDSLADLISFGLAPGCVIYSYLTLKSSLLHITSLPLIAFLLPVFAAIRLAKFNIDTRQKTSFLGLPVPASGLFWTSFIPSIHYYTELHTTISITVVITLLLVFCWLMISEIPMFSLKLKSFKWKDNQWPFSLILISIVLIIIFSCSKVPLLSVSLIIIVFIGLSLLKNTIK
jgi:CDP-diacylglycerol--serine O-phosphatidyltransferase